MILLEVGEGSHKISGSAKRDGLKEQHRLKSPDAGLESAFLKL